MAAAVPVLPWLGPQIVAPPPRPETLPAMMMVFQFLRDRGLIRSLAVFRMETAPLWAPFGVRSGSFTLICTVCIVLDSQSAVPPDRIGCLS